ncbi:ATP-binding protein [Desulfocurvibacter africanus]|nr:ATP-binding protein [Desulfocurvibacter africanus]
MDGAQGVGRKVVAVVILVAVITFLHYVTASTLHHYHAIYRELYFLPVMLAGFWFGLRGGLITSVSISLLYLPVIVLQWNGLSADDLTRILELILFNIVAAVLGRIADRERSEQRALREAERLAAMGKALSCVAHDMKAPLIAIGGFSCIIQRKLADSDPNRDKLKLIAEEASRLEAMVKDMLDFSKPFALNVEKNRIEDVVRRSLAMVEKTAAEKNVSIRLAQSENLPVLPMDNQRMEQVFINLLLNAVQASPADEVVSIEMRRGRGNMIIDIVDNGPGIPQEVREKLFTPFFTTKKGGTGLGLAISQKIMLAHGGAIRLLDNKVKGAHFRVELPLDAAQLK